jgi:hypothetical protein
VGKNSDNADANKTEGKRLPKKQTSREIRNPVEAADEMVGKAAASQSRTEALARGVRSSWVVKGRRRRCRGVAYLGRRERRVRLAGGRPSSDPSSGLWAAAMDGGRRWPAACEGGLEGGATREEGRTRWEATRETRGERAVREREIN